jgi:NitT/TauT family transport system ATP-binding protein
MIQTVDRALDDAIALEEIAFGFPPRNGSPGTLILEQFSLQVERASTLVVMGPSGVGKSTLGRLIAGGLGPQAGRIRYSSAIRSRSDVASVDQHPMNTVFPWQTVSGNLDYPLRKLGWTRRARAERVESLLTGFRLTCLGGSYPAELSGGELQRLALARSLSWRPRLVILDEALGALDIATRTHVLMALRAVITGDGTTAVVITHSISDAFDLADRCVVLGGRPARIVADFETRSASNAAVRNALLEAIRDGHL